ncbi:MAG: hypothetical protein ACR2OA_07200, partial [Rubripirellula sp.]
CRYKRLSKLMLSAKASSRSSVLAWKTPLREGLFTDRLSQLLRILNNARVRAFNQVPIIPDTQRMTTPLIEKPENTRYAGFSMKRGRDQILAWSHVKALDRS